MGAGGTAILLNEPPATGRSTRPEPRLFEPAADPRKVSLEEVVLRTWEDLAGSGSVGCPVCGGRMRVSAGCDACGSELS